jgi:nucleotide exchange factor SIL1
MTKFRLKMLPLNLLALIGLMAWGASASAGDSPSAPSPPADVELVCHTDNPAECYPKIFQATDEFQIVRPDQDLPPGLHVRLNVYTGLREAKINVPDEHDAALEGLPVDSSVVIVERDQAEEEQAKPPPNAPAYDAAGPVKKPKSADAGEGSAFYKSLTILKKGLDVDGALEMLEDISHDIYYGLKIAEDYDTIHELFCLSTTTSSSSSSSSDAKTALSRARLASLTLASTLQNNPKALASIEAHWPKLAPAICPSANGKVPLQTSIFTLPVDADADAPLTKARISLLTGLLKSPLFRAAFLSPPSSSGTTSTGNGPSHILRILTTTTTTQGENDADKEGEREWAQTQRRAAHLLLDTFLDADMGAVLGEWPTTTTSSKTQQLSDKECVALFDKAAAGNQNENGKGREEECLHWLVKGLTAQHKRDKEHWSHDLWRGIRDSEAKGKKEGKKTEKVDL